MASNTGTSYDVSYRVVDSVDGQGVTCGHCGENPITVNLYLPIGSDADHHVEVVNAESCLACVLPVLDTTDYLETSHTVVAEVARAATNRPF